MLKRWEAVRVLKNRWEGKREAVRQLKKRWEAVRVLKRWEAVEEEVGG